MDPIQAWRLGRAAIRNALQYQNQANLLADHGWYGRAAALATLGREEAGKGLYFLLVGIGALNLKPGSMRAMFRTHEWKQRFSRLPILVANSFLRCSAQAQELVQNSSGFTDIFAASGDGLEVSRLAARVQRFLIENESAMHAIFDPIMRDLKESLEGIEEYSVQSEKHDGLYVSFDEEERVAHCPDDVPRRSCQRQRASLRLALRVLRSFDGGLTDRQILELHQVMSRERSRSAASGADGLPSQGGRSPRDQALFAAVKALDKALAVATEANDAPLQRALEAARAPLSEHMAAMGLRLPAPGQKRGRRAQ